MDVTLNLSTGLYHPYQKPNSKINYIHRDSNHPPPPPPPPPPPIIKNLSKGIELRLSKNSANVNIFNKPAKLYNAALRTNGHKQQIQYTKNDKPEEKAAKANHNHTTGEINTPPNEKKKDEKNKKRIRKKHHLVQPSIQCHCRHQHRENVFRTPTHELPNKQQAAQNIK